MAMTLGGEDTGGASYLTVDEARRFCTDRLGIDPDGARHHDRRGFVDTLLRRFLIHTPFQSLSVLLRGGGPSLMEAKEAVLVGRGGLCFTTNIFIKHLLDRLGFHTQFAACHLHGMHTHYTVLIRGLEGEASLDCVDPGCGHIMPRAMTLPPVGGPPTRYVHRHLTVEWGWRRERGRNILTRQHSKADAGATRAVRDLFWDMTLEPVSTKAAGESLRLQLQTYCRLRVAIARGPNAVLRGYRGGAVIDSADQGLRRVALHSRAAMIESLAAEPELAAHFDRAAIARALDRLPKPA